MVKHQRRSHQRGIHPSELDDCTSDSDSGESPSTPKMSNIPWPQVGIAGVHPIHGHTIQRAASFADFGQHMNSYNMQQQFAHRHSVSTSGSHEYPHQAVHEAQHPSAHMLHRTASMPQHSYYVTEHSNPGVATMNTNPMPQYQVPRQQVERPLIEIPYSGPAMTGSIQSSPGTFSPASGRSPSVHQEGFYTHQPAQAATYALQNTSPVESQQPMVQYQQMQQVQASQAAAQPVHQVQEQYQTSAPQREEQWYNGMPYQAPVEVATIGQLPSYGSGGVYDPWAVKADFEDPTMQLPSARLESM
jgi:metal regulatory transcription factor 1